MPSFSSLFNSLVIALAFASTGYGASLQTVTNWGENPSGIAQMQIYVPDKLAAKPAIILGVRFSLIVSKFLTYVLVTPLRRYWANVLSDDQAAKICRPARVCFDLPYH